MARVVTVTSIAVQRDSRTYKFAASIARLGHESIVVEGEASTMLGPGLPFELRSPPAPAVAVRGAQEAILDEEPAPAPTLDPIRRAVAATMGSANLARLYARDALERNRRVSALLPDADVYWLHGYWQFPAVHRKARRAGARFLYDTPDAYWEPGQTPAGNRTERFLIGANERSERRCVQRAEAFTSVSDGLADLLERRFGRRPRVVRNAHDLRIDGPSEGDVRASSNVGKDDFLLVVIGNLKPELAAREALRATAELPERVHVAFVGRGHDANIEFADSIGLAGRAHMLGHVAPTEITSFIRTADAAPVLSLARTNNDIHSLPNKFFHAVAAGLPVLYPGLPEMAALGHRYDLGVEIDPADPASIAAGVRSLLDDPAEAARYRANVAKAREGLNWEQEERVLAEILDGSGG